MLRFSRRRVALLGIAWFVLLGASAAVAQSTWTKAAAFPEPDEELYGTTLNGKMYVIGGFGGGRARGIVYEYDPSADRWTKKKPMALPAHHEALATLNGKIYVIGGFIAPANGPAGAWQPIDNAWEYDPVADTWKPLPPM